MARNIETYLRELQAAMTGADPALVQDALFDAEEHLRSEITVHGYGAGSGGMAPTEVATFASIVDAYGTPEEVAAAYLGEPAAGLGGIPPRTRWRRFLAVVTDASVYKSLLYMLLSLVTGVIYFTIVVTGLSLSGALIILIIGVPFFLLFLGVVRALSFFEGRLVETLLETRMPRRPRSELKGAGLLERVLFWIKDSRTWLAMVYMVLQLLFGTVYFTVAVSGLAISLGMIVIPFVQLASKRTFINIGLHAELVLPIWSMPLLIVGGVLLFVIWLHLVRGIGHGHAAYAKAMLVRLAK